MIRHDTAKQRPTVGSKTKAPRSAKVMHAGAPLVTIHTANLARLAKVDKGLADRLVKSLCHHLPALTKAAARAGAEAKLAASTRAIDGAYAADGSHADQCWLHHTEIRDCGEGGDGLCVWEWYQCSEGGGYWLHFPVE